MAITRLLIQINFFFWMFLLFIYILSLKRSYVMWYRISENRLACEQALIFVVIIDVARAAKPRATSRRGVWYVKIISQKKKSFIVPDPSPARCTRRLVTRGFAARATSVITTKRRARSQLKTDMNVLSKRPSCAIYISAIFRERKSNFDTSSCCYYVF